MKSLLILYPIQPYADSLIGNEELPAVKIKFAQIYQDLIEKRYPDYRKIYVLFSTSDNSENADLSQLWQGLLLNGTDIIGSCGITFERHCKDYLYPKQKRIIDLCPQPVDELVIGGFHLWDCVDKTAKWAHRHGINVLVDEDLTELFFYSSRDSRGQPVSKIPVSKEESLKQERKELIEAGDHFLEYANNERKKRPWMNQI